jgi:P4 family phage/plasmid primase-like protien
MNNQDEIETSVSDQPAQQNHRERNAEAVAFMLDRLNDGKPFAEIEADAIRKGYAPDYVKAWIDDRAEVEMDAHDRRAITSPTNGAKGGRPSAPPASTTAREYAADKLTMPDGHLVARHYRDAWYRFADGWHMVTDGEMEKAVTTYMQDREDLARFATPHYARSILSNLASFNLCGIQGTVEKPCWLSTGQDARQWVAFSNGIAVDVLGFAEQIARGETPRDYTKPVSPDLFSADFVSYPWDEAQEPRRFAAYLERVLPDPESRKAVQRMYGVLIADVSKYEVFWQMYGGGANGKTVSLDIQEALVGRRNVSRVGIEAFAPGTRFQTFPLSEVKANIAGELATDLGRTAFAAMEGAFKHAVSGGTIEIERKGLDKIEARCRARFVMAGNSLPTFFDKSDAIWRRLRIIPFSVQIPEAERDPDLAATIIAEELPAICRWALEGLADVIRAGRVEDCPAGLAMKDAHRTTCDHERTFLAECYEAGDHEDRMKAADLYEHYRTWMQDNGYRGVLGTAKFVSRVIEIHPHAQHGAMRIHGHAKTVRGFSGVRTVDPEHVVTLVTPAIPALCKPKNVQELGLQGARFESVTSVTSVTTASQPDFTPSTEDEFFDSL